MASIVTNERCRVNLYYSSKVVLVEVWLYLSNEILTKIFTGDQPTSEEIKNRCKYLSTL